MKTIILSKNRCIKNEDGTTKCLLKRKAPKGYQKVNTIVEAYLYDVKSKQILSRALVSIEKIDIEYIRWAYKTAPSGSQLPITERTALYLMKKCGLENANVAYLYTVLTEETYKKPIKLSTLTNKSMMGEFIYINRK